MSRVRNEVWKVFSPALPNATMLNLDQIHWTISLAFAGNSSRSKLHKLRWSISGQSRASDANSLRLLENLALDPDFHTGSPLWCLQEALRTTEARKREQHQSPETLQSLPHSCAGISHLRMRQLWQRMFILLFFLCFNHSSWHLHPPRPVFPSADWPHRINSRQQPGRAWSLKHTSPSKHDFIPINIYGLQI